jgi:hypothetical protein
MTKRKDDSLKVATGSGNRSDWIFIGFGIQAVLNGVVGHLCE